MKKLRPDIGPPLLNISHRICEHFLGENHTANHRITVGSIIMVIGVVIAHAHVEHIILSVTANTVGYTLHAIGSFPIMEKIIEFHKKPLPQNDEQS